MRLVLLALVSICLFANAQTKIYVTVGYNLFGNEIKSSEVGKIPALPSGQIGFEIDSYLNYTTAITTGLSYWTYGYDTKGTRRSEYGIQSVRNNGLALADQISNQWRNNLLQVPLGIKYAPKGYTSEVTLGININYLLKSTARDLKDSLNHYFTTDVTSALPRIQPDMFIGGGFKFRRFKISVKYIFALTNRYSSRVKGVTEKKADEVNSDYFSWFSFALQSPESAGKVKYSITQITIGYRL